MNLFSGGFGARVRLVTRAVEVLLAYPVFLGPLILCWFCIAFIYTFVFYLYPWQAWPGNYRLLIAFGVALGAGLVITTASHVSLELIEQVEEGRPISFWRASLSALGPNLFRSLPIVFVWATLWSFLIAINLVLGEDDDGGSDGASMLRAMRTVAGDLRSFSLSRAYFQALNKTLRMTIFLILPCIAWEGRGPIRAAQKGLAALRLHAHQFAVGVFSSELLLGLLILPAMILFSFAREFESNLSIAPTAAATAYITFAWTFVVYVEQMFAAELYLWHLRWASAREQANEGQDRSPGLDDVLRPSLLDNIPELADRSRS